MSVKVSQFSNLRGFLSLHCTIVSLKFSHSFQVWNDNKHIYHNVGKILRTEDIYNVQFLIVARKNDFYLYISFSFMAIAFSSYNVICVTLLNVLSNILCYMFELKRQEI